MCLVSYRDHSDDQTLLLSALLDSYVNYLCNETLVLYVTSVLYVYIIMADQRNSWFEFFVSMTRPWVIWVVSPSKYPEHSIFSNQSESSIDIFHDITRGRKRNTNWIAVIFFWIDKTTFTLPCFSIHDYLLNCS